MNMERETGASMAPRPDAVLEWAAMAPADGTLCALLTPAIKARLRELAPGQTLEVRVSDPTAREDIASWCRLAGHELLAMVEEPGPPPLLRAYLRKKQS